MFSPTPQDFYHIKDSRGDICRNLVKERQEEYWTKIDKT